jgi:Family of unknown function (DUF5690)
MAAADEARAKPVTTPLFVLWAGGAAFGAYFAMYAFRKPFSAAHFAHAPGWDFALDYKSALVIAQVIGYALSKFIGVKIIAEMDARHRAPAIVALIGLAWLALVGFALTPPPYSVAMLFLNGLPLGMIWGLVFGFLEGRRTTEALGAILCASFIVSSGVVKSVGAWLMAHWAISESCMPAATGALFFPLLLVCVLGLAALPPPDSADEAARTPRAPMNAAKRMAFLRLHGLGLAILVIAYVLFTAFRDLRDNFAAEIWAALGYKDVAAAFTLSELPIALCVMAPLGLFMFLRDNRKALVAMHGVIALGAAAIGVSTLAFQAGWLSPMAWMILSGAGLYLAYTPFNAMLFDRLIAASHIVGNAGFLIYVADASGYAGSVALLLVKNFAAPEIAWLPFFTAAAYAASGLGLALSLASALYFFRRLRSTG